MSRGGARPGAGRKPGTRNKKTREQVEAIEKSGLTPLEYLLSVLRDDARETVERMDAAKAAAPYCHARLSNVEVKGDVDAPLVTRIELVAPAETQD